MAEMSWRGDAQARRQVDRITATNVEVGDSFTLTINRKDATFTATTTNVDDVYAGLASLVGSSATDPEFREITAQRTRDGVAGLWLLGPTDGTPFTVTTSTTNGGAPAVAIVETVPGSAKINQQQQVEITATGGTFTLAFLGSATSGLAFNASAATIQTALEGLGTIGAGNVAVALGGTSGNTHRWIVTFQGAFAGTSQPLLVANGGSLTGGLAGVVTETVKGSATLNHRYRLVLQVVVESGATNNCVIRAEFMNPLTYSSAFSGILGCNQPSPAAVAALIQSGLEAMPNIGAGNVGVSVVTSSAAPAWNALGATLTLEIEFRGVFAGVDITPGVLPGLAFTNVVAGSIVSQTETQTGSATPVNEKQTINFNGIPSAGTWSATFNGQTASSLAHNISASALQTALQALSSIGSGNCTVTAVTTAGITYWTVEFTNARGGQDQPPIAVNVSGLTGGPASVAQIRAGFAGANEVQRVTLTGSPSGGTFTLTFGANTTSALAWNAAASVVQAALEALASIGSGNCAVGGAPGGPWDVTFVGALATTPLALMTGDGASLTSSAGTQTLTRAAIVTPTGPAWWSEAENWSSGAVPATGDVAVFEDNAQPCLYGLAQSGVTLLRLRIEASYSGAIGLPDRNVGGYLEYRAKRLAIGATNVDVGVGDGAASDRIRLDCGSVQTTVDVWRTGIAADDGVGAFDWLGTHAANVVRVYRGSVSIAPASGEAATVATLRVDWLDSQDADATVAVGPGVTLTNVTKTGGALRCESAISGTLTHDGGTTDLRGSGAVATITATGGRIEYAAGGNPTTIAVSGTGVVSFAQDARPKVVTNAPTVDGDEADVLDPYRALRTNGISPNGLAIDYTNTSRAPGLGRAFRLVRAN